MAYPVVVPRESEEMELCQVIRWHVKKGAQVRQGDILCEVDTGKATFDIEAVASGVLLDIFYHENEEAPLLLPWPSSVRWGRSMRSSGRRRKGGKLRTVAG